MVQHLTYHHRLSSNKRLFQTPGRGCLYLCTKKVGKTSKSACGVSPGSLQRDRALSPKVLMRLSKTKNTSAEPMVVLCVLSKSVTGSNRVRKQNKHEAF